MLERLKKNAEILRIGNIDMIRADLRFLPIRRRCLDGVVCCSVFYYIPKYWWYAAILQFAHGLRQRGVLFVQFKKYRGMFRLEYLFGVLYLGLHVVRKLQERTKCLSWLTRGFKLPGRVEYLTSSASVVDLLRECFDELLVEENGVYINCQCKGSHIPEDPSLSLADSGFESAQDQRNTSAKMAVW